MKSLQPFISNNLFSSWNPLFIHLFFSCILYLFLYQIGEIKQLPTNTNLVNWDAGIYLGIKENGYSLNNETLAGNTGFYPLFPYLWSFLNVSPIGISLINLAIFLLSLQWITKTYSISAKTLLLFLSIPSISFFVLPYAESIFFLFSALLLIGWKKNNNLLIIIACIFAGITRPSILYFIPAVCFVFAYNWISGNLEKSKISSLLIILLSTFIGILLSFFIYYKTTGDPFAFFRMRENGNSFSWPVFPLTTWRGTKLLWLDGLSFTICLAVITYFIKLIYDILFKKSRKVSVERFEILFPIGYFIITTIHILFFNIKDSTGHTSLLGLNRFVFATPFFLLLLNHTQQINNISSKFRNWILLITALGMSLIGVFHPDNFPNHLRPAIYISIISIYWINQFKINQSWVVLYIINTILQVIIFGKFLQGLWIG